MKKILLVENVLLRYEKAKSDLLPIYEDVLTISQIIPRREQDSKYSLEEFAAILLHKNYYENNERMIDNVVFDLNKLKLPFILFSGESPYSTSTVVSHNDFYKNIPFFLENYQNKKILNFKILRYGKHFEYEEILILKEKIMIGFINKKFSETLVLSPEQKINLEKLLLKMNYNPEKIKKSLSNLSDTSKYKSIEEFINRMNLIIERISKGLNENTSL